MDVIINPPLDPALNDFVLIGPEELGISTVFCLFVCFLKAILVFSNVKLAV